MSNEHGTALPEIRPDVMIALLKYDINAAAVRVLNRCNRRQEAEYYRQCYFQASDELEALGVLDEEDNFDLTPAEYRALIDLYAYELAYWQATTFQENAPEVAA